MADSFSTLLQQFLSKTSGLSKQNNMFKYKEKWMKKNINCKKKKKKKAKKEQHTDA